MAYKKRYNRRYKNKTKRFNKYAYAKTDSKNQAKQIVQLNKKISNVYKTLRPELIKRHYTWSVDVSADSATIIKFDSMLNIGEGSSLNDLFKGNYAKFIYFNFKFYFNSTNLDLTKGKTLRIVILQNRVGTDTAPNTTDIFQFAQSILSPFKEGVNNKYKILLDKRYSISDNRDYLIKTYNFKKLIGYNKLYGTTQTLKYGRGSIFVYLITNQTEKYSVSYTSSLGYTDTE